MANVKGAKLAARTGRVGPRKHYCPTCLGDSREVSDDAEAKAIMALPGRKIIFGCRAGHRHNKGQTILL